MGLSLPHPCDQQQADDDIGNQRVRKIIVKQACQACIDARVEGAFGRSGHSAAPLRLEYPLFMLVCGLQ